MTTSRTLVQRLRDPRDGDAWARFFELYAPALETYARARGLSATDAEEVRDECLEIVSRRMPAFEYDRARGGFRRWLHTVARGVIVDRLRRRRETSADTGALQALADPRPGPDELWRRAWRREELRYAFAEARRSEPPRAVEVFELLLRDELGVAEVCARTGLRPAAVYKAKSRVLARVREVLRRLGTTE